MRIYAKAMEIFPYLRARRPVPSPGSQDIVFLSINLPPYQFIGGGQAYARQFFSYGAVNIRQQVGITGPGGFLTGQLYNPPLAGGPNGSININGVSYTPGTIRN